MQSKIESPSTLEQSLDFSVSSKEIREMINSRLKKLAKTTKIPGFRPGKVPLKMVAQQYEEGMRNEVLNDVLKKNFNVAAKAQHLHVVGYPRFEEKQQNDSSDKDKAVFSAFFEVYPKIVLVDLSQTSIERPVVEIQVSDVANTLKILCKQRAQYVAVERQVVVGDRVNIDYHGLMDGVEFDGNNATDISVMIGEGKFLKDFEASIVGMSKGQEKSFEVNFPSDYHNNKLAGKVAMFEVKLNSVDVPVLPVVDAEFAKLLGIADGDVQKMHEGIKQNLEWEVSKRIRIKLKDQVMQLLLEKVACEAPNVLINQEVERLIQNTREHYEKHKMKYDDAAIKPELFYNRAEQRVKLGLILAELIKKFELKAETEQVRKIVVDSARDYEDPEEVIKWHYALPERLQEAKSIALEDSVMMWVLQQGKVADKAWSFDEIMGVS